MPAPKPITNHTRKLGKTGNPDSPSYFLTVPIEIIRKLKWSEGQNVQVRMSRGKIVLSASEVNSKT